MGRTSMRAQARAPHRAGATNATDPPSDINDNPPFPFNLVYPNGGKFAAEISLAYLRLRGPMARIWPRRHMKVFSYLIDLAGDSTASCERPVIVACGAGLGI